MNSSLRIAGIMLFAVSNVTDAQVVVEDTNLIFTPDSSVSSANLRGTIYQDIAATDITSAWFAYDGLNMTGVTSNLDAGSDWYLVSEDDEFGPTAIASGQFPPIIDCCPTYHSAAVGFDFFLGIATTSPQGFPDRDVFGWAHIVNGVMVDNAIAYHSPGIIVGTSTILPEPAGSATAIAVLPLLFILGRRHNSPTGRRGRTNGCTGAGIPSRVRFAH